MREKKPVAGGVFIYPVDEKKRVQIAGQWYPRFGRATWGARLQSLS